MKFFKMNFLSICPPATHSRAGAEHRRAAAELGGARASRPPARTPRALKVCWTIAGPSVCIYAQGMRSS